MQIAIIVIAAVLGVGLIAFFTVYYAVKHKAAMKAAAQTADTASASDSPADNVDSVVDNEENAQVLQDAAQCGLKCANAVASEVQDGDVSEQSKVGAKDRLNSGFARMKQWFSNHRPSKRRLIQLYAALLYNANIKGFITGSIYTSETTKYMCVPGLNCYSCPGAVGACPLGALQNALAESQTRAPYYILGILGIFGLMLARTVCGFLCPIGLCQELLYKVRTPKVKKNRVTRIFSYLKYVILALAIALPLIYAAFDIPLPAFCKYICPAGTLGGAVMLLINPNNSALFGQLGWQFTWKFCLAIAIVVASVFIFRFFCRFLCPLGAIYGFFNRFALIGVKVDKDSCTDCGLCVLHCKMDIKHVGDHECINCGECIAVCPAKAISWKGSKLFLRHSAEAEALSVDIKPITVVDGKAMLISDATALNSADLETPQTEAASEISVDKKEFNEQAKALYDERKTISEAEEHINVKPKRPAKFWVEMVVWILAAVLLVTALVYYNAIDVDRTTVTPPNEEVTTGNKVGDIAPDFTVSMYGQGGQFNLYQNRGKLTVVNFWATWCTPCVAEIPYFDQLQSEHSEISVIAIHGSSTRDVQEFINDNWPGHSLMFAQDNLSGTQCLTFKMFGGTTMWPMTVVIDEEGKILYNSTQSFRSYEQLETLILSLIA